MKRASCNRCKRPINYCYCDALTPTPALVDIIILQHPSEVKHPLNTARIVVNGIENAQLWVGEDFTEHAQLNALLSTKRCALLFPTQDAQSSETFLPRFQPEVIIVLDGTWRKAKKIYFSTPALQNLPALVIHSAQRSNYRLRKAPSNGALSTVEATVYLLRDAAQDDTAHQPLLDVFEHMIDQQIAAMGAEVYAANHQR